MLHHVCSTFFILINTLQPSAQPRTCSHPPPTHLLTHPPTQPLTHPSIHPSTHTSNHPFFLHRSTRTLPTSLPPTPQVLGADAPEAVLKMSGNGVLATDASSAAPAAAGAPSKAAKRRKLDARTVLQSQYHHQRRQQQEQQEREQAEQQLEKQRRQAAEEEAARRQAQEQQELADQALQRELHLQLQEQPPLPAPVPPAAAAPSLPPLRAPLQQIEAEHEVILDQILADCAAIQQHDAWAALSSGALGAGESYDRVLDALLMGLDSKLMTASAAERAGTGAAAPDIPLTDHIAFEQLFSAMGAASAPLAVRPGAGGSAAARSGGGQRWAARDEVSDGLTPSGGCTPRFLPTPEADGPWGGIVPVSEAGVVASKVAGCAVDYGCATAAAAAPAAQYCNQSGMLIDEADCAMHMHGCGAFADCGAAPLASAPLGDDSCCSAQGSGRTGCGDGAPGTSGSQRGRSGSLEDEFTLDGEMENESITRALVHIERLLQAQPELVLSSLHNLLTMTDCPLPPDAAAAHAAAISAVSNVVEHQRKRPFVSPQGAGAVAAPHCAFPQVHLHRGMEFEGDTTSFCAV